MAGMPVMSQTTQPTKDNIDTPKMANEAKKTSTPKVTTPEKTMPKTSTPSKTLDIQHLSFLSQLFTINFQL